METSIRRAARAKVAIRKGWAQHSFAGFAGVACLVCGLALLPVSVLAQSPAIAPAGPASHPASGSTGVHKAARHSKSGKAPAAKLAAEPAPVVETPAPPPPDWPANAAAVPATVAWDGRALSISATNASLEQILHDVSTSTGMKIEGLGAVSGGQKEQRIYGSYGPAPARDVLGKLLEGSGMNVMMIGDKGEGTPRELVLTAKVGGKAPSVSAGQVNQGNQNAEEEVQEDPEPVDPPPPPDQNLRRPLGFQPGQQGPTPQQILQDIQQRQQQLQQQQQPGAPPQAAPND